MNRLNKIFLIINIILIIVLGIITYLYFDMRSIAKKNLEAYVEAAKEIYNWTQIRDQSNNIE